jgi:hypothetical protein
VHISGLRTPNDGWVYRVEAFGPFPRRYINANFEEDDGAMARARQQQTEEHARASERINKVIPIR